MCVRKRPIPDASTDVDIATASSARQMIMHEPKTKVDMTEGESTVYGFGFGGVGVCL